MSLLATLRARARDVLSRTPPAADGPVASHSAAPRPSALGRSPWTLGAVGPRAAQPPAAWDRDPESGAALPVGPHPAAGPTEWQAARNAHRHGWFPALAHAAARGDASAAGRAVAAMESWLRQDVPGTGLAWAHASDAAVRLVHWQAGLAWLGDAAPASLRDAMAGSAGWHLDHLAVRTPPGELDGPRRILHHAGRVVGGFLFTDLDQARVAWSEGLAGLRADLPAVMHADGSPKDGAPMALAEALWLASVARATARANGAGFPAEADAALVRGAHFVERLAGSVGPLPALGDRFVGSALDADYPLAWSLWNLVIAWGLDPGDAAARASEDPRLAWLGGSPGPEAAASGSKGWSVWVWREAGYGLAEMKIKNRASRVVAHHGPSRGGLGHQAPLQVVWDLGELSIIADPGPAMDNPELADGFRAALSHNGVILDGKAPAADACVAFDLGRVDGKKARLEGHHDGWGRQGIPLTARRKVMMNQARMTVTDHLVPTRASVGRHAVQLAWQFGPGWSLEYDGKQWQARQAGITVVMVLPETLSWTLVSGQTHPHPLGWVGREPAPCLVGSGGLEGELKLECSFEVR